ncbi:Inner membrane ALBINO3-like protein 1, chloroplastic [Quillaja saponaria]|uniref:Inner membrane ALBINO3-like protein 1, chloroplastic n=1 Tax=Quillaja saponaria TaxID=32244 RepID=A0AAD7LG99_QUISA|nr:Inner membrane ALBINO3-like protein 1, chloroplastic [Quillaja saponaria]KAJ7957654.1 Inner membrane ALBINO3-like protein 1, chloroplastic [Quillaja saponaria]KAJ7957655.1 Inner membrane ALBINO3-like protein 1, chloroplastic [Quillaja saponaria]
MASLLAYGPNTVFAPFVERTRTSNPLFRRPQFHGFYHSKPFLRGSSSVTRFGFNSGFFDPDATDEMIRELFGRAEGLIYTIADAAVSSSDTVATTTKQNNDWLSGITNYMETVLKVLKDGLSTLHVPYAYGFAIILLTVVVKAATFPLTKKQVESAMAMRSFQPQVKAIQQKYAGDQERIQLETARLYKLAGVNPLAGCLPTLATIPVWIGLYRALSNVADEGLLTEGFFWIPSLAGPTTIAARQNGSGISWLFPFVDGQPPLGWSDTLAYLVLPILLVVSQYISVQIMQSSQSNDPSMKSSQALTKILPLMIGYFALSVPSGLSLYWFTNNILSTAQQVWLQKLGGAKVTMRQVRDDVIKEDQIQIQNSVSEVNSPPKEARQGEKLTAEGPKAGERFKQLKEQEVRRRRQREEQKRKAEEAELRGSKADEGYEKGDKLLQGGNGAAADLVVEKVEELQSVTAINDLPTSGVSMNGNLCCQNLEEDQITSSAVRMENDEASSNGRVDGRDKMHSYEILKKDAVEVHTSTTTSDTKLPEDNTYQIDRSIRLQVKQGAD